MTAKVRQRKVSEHTHPLPPTPQHTRSSAWWLLIREGLMFLLRARELKTLKTEANPRSSLYYSPQLKGGSSPNVYKWINKCSLYTQWTIILPSEGRKFFFWFFFFFFFGCCCWQSPQHSEVPRPRTEPGPQQRQRWILSPLCHQGTPEGRKF